MPLMLPLDLSHTDYRTLMRGLRTHHEVRVGLHLQNLDGDGLSLLTNRLIGGQVNIDGRATPDTPTRSATLSLSDALGRMTFESDSPDDAALYVDRMLRINYGVRITGLGWVDIPVFTGPISKMDRQADIINVECHGKETLAMGAAFRVMHWKRNTRKSDVIHDLMFEGAGERFLDIPDRPERLHDDFSIGRRSIIWAEAIRLAASMGCQLFYDGRGHCRLREPGQGPDIRFMDGDGGTVQGPPQISYTTDNLKNVVWVTGGVPKGQKKAVEKIVIAQRNHPLSPWKLGRTTGTVLRPQYRVEDLEAGDIKSENEAQDAGEKRLLALLDQQVDVSFDSWPTNPLVEELDTAVLTTTRLSHQFRMKQTAIPLICSETQPVGYLRNVTPHKRKGHRNVK